MLLLRSLSIIFSFAAGAWPQAVVEHATTTAASSTAASSAKGVGKSVSGVFDSLKKTLDKAGKPGITTAVENVAVAPARENHPAATVSDAAKSAEIAPSAPKPIDPAQITIGLDVEDLVKRCGEPSMSVSVIRDSESIETYWYEIPHNKELEVTLREGVVTSVKLKARLQPAPH